MSLFAEIAALAKRLLGPDNVGMAEKIASEAIRTMSDRTSSGNGDPFEEMHRPEVRDAFRQIQEKAFRLRVGLELPTLYLNERLMAWKGTLPNGEPLRCLALMPAGEDVSDAELMTRYLRCLGHELADPGEGSSEVPDIIALATSETTTLDEVILPRIGLTQEAFDAFTANVEAIMMARTYHPDGLNPFVQVMTRTAWDAFTALEAYRQEANRFFAAEMIDVASVIRNCETAADRDAASQPSP